MNHLDTLDRLFNWFEEHLPQVPASFNPPASEEGIETLEKTFGHPLPEALRAFYRRCDGQVLYDADSTVAPGLFYGLSMYSVAEVLSDWKSWCDIIDQEDDDFLNEFQVSARPGTIKAVYANRGWLPIAHDSSSNLLAIDFDPGPKGTVGQVINAGRDEEIKHVIAKSFADFLVWYLEQLEKGNYIIKPQQYGTSFGTKDPPEYGLLDAVQVMFGPPSRFDPEPTSSAMTSPAGTQELGQQIQALERWLDEQEGVSSPDRSQVVHQLVSFVHSGGSKPGDPRWPALIDHEYALVMSLECDRRGPDMRLHDSRLTQSESWAFLHKWMLDTNLIDYTRFVRVESMRTDPDGKGRRYLRRYKVQPIKGSGTTDYGHSTSGFTIRGPIRWRMLWRFWKIRLLARK